MRIRNVVETIFAFDEVRNATSITLNGLAWNAMEAVAEWEKEEEDEEQQFWHLTHVHISAIGHRTISRNKFGAETKKKRKKQSVCARSGDGEGSSNSLPRSSGQKQCECETKSRHSERGTEHGQIMQALI